MWQERDLIFGFLAARLQGVAPRLLARARSACVADPGLSLAQCLVEQGAITESGRDLLEQLAAEILRLRSGNVAAGLDALGGAAQVWRVFEGKDDSESLMQMQTLPFKEESELTLLDDLSPTPPLPTGRYTRVSEYARGGMARVLIVHDEHLGRNIALKELMPVSAPSGPGVDPAVLRKTAALTARFLREARLTGQLEHPAIVPVYELGIRENGAPYYTMKLVRGKTLADALRGCHTLIERLNLLPHFIDLCHAIAYAHQRKVIHRDIKPANVMAGEFGETVVLDWGLAKAAGMSDIHDAEIRAAGLAAADEANEALPRTAYGRALGTPHYMSPEQAQGQTERIDERSDVYSLGAVLYEFLTGRPPFSGTNIPKILDAVIRHPLTPVRVIEPQAPPELAGICEKALNKDPDRRYQTAKELIEDIQRYQTGALVQAHEYTLLELFRRFYLRHRAVLITSALAVLAFLVLGAFSYARILEARNREHAQRLAAENAQRDALLARDQEERARLCAEAQSYVSQIRLAEAAVTARNYTLAADALWKTAESHRNWEWGYLLNECNLDEYTVAAHNNLVLEILFSPDGRRIATLATKDSVKIWDAATGSPVARTDPPAGWWAGMAFDATGARLAAGASDGSATIWDAETGQRLLVLKGHAKTVDSVTFSTDGARLLTASADGNAKIWDLGSRRELATLTNHAAALRRAAFSPDGTRILTVSADASITLWDAASFAFLQEFEGSDAIWSPAGPDLAAWHGTQVEVWRAGDDKPKTIFAQHSGGVNRAEFSPDGHWVASSSDDGTVRVWESATGSERFCLQHGEPMNRIVFSPDSGYLLTFARGPKNVASLWSMRDGKRAGLIEGHSAVTSLGRFSPDGRQIATGSMDRTLKLWNVEHLVNRNTFAHHAQGVNDLAFSTDGKWIATASLDNTTRIADSRTGIERLVIASFAHSGGKAVAFSPDGTHAALAQDPFTPMVLDLEKGTLSAAFSGHAGCINSVAFSPDGTRVVTASWDSTARVWDAATGKEYLTLKGHSRSVSSALYSPDGRFILTASADDTARIWDAATGELVRILTGHANSISRAAYSPDGMHVVTASADRTARIWESNTAQQCLVLAGHSGSIWSALYSPDGSRIVTASTDETARIWAADSGECLAMLPGNAWFLSRACFDHDGRRILAASADGRVCLWESAPWRSDDLPGTSNMAWKDRFSLWKQRRPVARAPISGTDTPWILIASPDRVENQLRRLREVLQQESSDHAVENAGTLPGFLLAPGGRANAMARLCFLPGDRILAVNGLPVANREETLDAIEKYLSLFSGAVSEPLSIRFIRNEKTAAMRTVWCEPSHFKRQVTIPRDQAIQILQWECMTLRQERENLLSACQEHARKAGEPVTTPGGLQGIKVFDTLDARERDLYLYLGVAVGDFIVRMDGVPVNDIDALLQAYETALHMLEEGNQCTVRWDIERGEFQRLELTIQTQ